MRFYRLRQISLWLLYAFASSGTSAIRSSEKLKAEHDTRMEDLCRRRRESISRDVSAVLDSQPAKDIQEIARSVAKRAEY